MNLNGYEWTNHGVVGKHNFTWRLWAPDGHLVGELKLDEQAGVWLRFHRWSRSDDHPQDVYRSEHEGKRAVERSERYRTMAIVESLEEQLEWHRSGNGVEF